MDLQSKLVYLLRERYTRPLHIIRFGSSVVGKKHRAGQIIGTDSSRRQDRTEGRKRKGLFLLRR